MSAEGRSALTYSRYIIKKSSVSGFTKLDAHIFKHTELMTSIGIAPGKLVRAPFLYQRERPIIIAPIDDFLLFGPRGGLENRTALLAEFTDSAPDAVLTYVGGIARFPQELARVGRIVNLSASTFRTHHTRKVRVHSIKSALRVHASAIAFHINIGSEHTNEMIHLASEVIDEAELYQIPTLGIVYPRGEQNGQDYNYLDLKENDPDAYADAIAHCVSVAVDLGFDAIKTQYTDNPQTFERVVAAADNVPILVAGGPLMDFEKAVARAREAISAGASGISYGRNLFGRTNPGQFVSEIRRITNSPEEH